MEQQLRPTKPEMPLLLAMATEFSLGSWMGLVLAVGVVLAALEVVLGPLATALELLILLASAAVGVHGWRVRQSHPLPPQPPAPQQENAVARVCRPTSASRSPGPCRQLLHLWPAFVQPAESPSPRGFGVHQSPRPSPYDASQPCTW